MTPLSISFVSMLRGFRHWMPPVRHFDHSIPHGSRHKAMWLLLRSHGDTKSNSFESIGIMKGLVDGECWHSVYFGDIAAGPLCLRSHISMSRQFYVQAYLRSMLKS